MTASSALASGRAAMEALMLDTCRVTKPGPGGKGPLNESTGKYDTRDDRVPVYEGRCRIQVKADINSNVVESTAGDHEATYLTATLQLPIFPGPTDTGDPGDILPDYVAEILTATEDPTLVDRLFNIQGTYHKSQATHRRLRVREVIA